MRQKSLFTVSATCYLLSSVSVLPMGAGDISGKNGSALLAVVSAVTFWLMLVTAITAQLLLRRQQKPCRKKQPLLTAILSPPAWWFEALFLLGIFIVILFSFCRINSFVFYIGLFLVLWGFELSILTAGKFKRKEGKLVLNIYHTQRKQGGNFIE